MKNVLNIDSTNICTCTMVSSIDDKTARVVLNITVNTTLNPRLEIVNFRTIELNTTTTEIELAEVEIKGSGNLQFRIVDDSKTGDYFTITKVASLDESLYIKQESNYSYTLKLKATQYDTALSTTSTNAVQNKVVTAALNNKANLPDSALSTSSTNAVQNKVVTSTLDNLNKISSFAVNAGVTNTYSLTHDNYLLFIARAAKGIVFCSKTYNNTYSIIDQSTVTVTYSSGTLTVKNNGSVQALVSIINVTKVEL